MPPRGRVPAVEDPTVFALCKDVMAAIAHTSPSWAALLPMTVESFDETLKDNMRVSYSVLRIDRYLARVCRTKDQVPPPPLRPVQRTRGADRSHPAGHP